MNGGLLDQRNVLDALHRAGKRGGFHVFRRFRFALLRKAGVPEHLIKLWLGHSQDLTDRYAAQLYEDVACRREWCEKTGLDLSWANCVTKASSQFALLKSRKPIVRQVLELVAGVGFEPTTFGL